MTQEQKEYNIFGWSQWKDITVFTWCSDSYVLQGKKHRRGKTRFRIANPRGRFKNCQSLTEEQLKQAGLWKQ